MSCLVYLTLVLAQRPESLLVCIVKSRTHLQRKMRQITLLLRHQWGLCLNKDDRHYEEMERLLDGEVNVGVFRSQSLAVGSI